MTRWKSNEAKRERFNNPDDRSKQPTGVKDNQPGYKITNLGIGITNRFKE
jgi:hypothetical protein